MNLTAFPSVGNRLTAGLCLILSALVSLSVRGDCPMLNDKGEVWQRDVFTGGPSKPEGYRLFRLPSVVAYGSLVLLFAEGRENSRSDPGDSDSMDIVYKRSEDYGATWGPLHLLADGSGPPSGLATRVAYQPTVVMDTHPGHRRLYLFYNRNSVRPFYRYSDDLGLSWSGEIDLLESIDNLPESYKKMSVNLASGVQLNNGYLVIPMNTILPGDPSGSNRPSVVYSDDHGATWHYGGHAEPGANEHQITEVFPGGVPQLYSSSRPDAYTGTAPDRRVNFGIFNQSTEQWDWGAGCAPVDTCGMKIQATTVSAAVARYTRANVLGETVDRLLLTLPRGTTGNGELVRRDLSVYVSEDEGRTYDRPRLLGAGLAAYSDIANVDGDCFLVAWERGSSESAEFVTLSAANRSFLDKAKYK